MKRAILGLGLAAMFAVAPVAAGTAAAAPPIRTTILLTCDKTVDAQVTLTLQTDVGGGDLTTVTNSDLNCGPDSASGSLRARKVVTTTVPAGAVLVTQFDAVSGSATLDCHSTTSNALPITLDCSPVGGATAQLSLK
jgi:hypothetical protein